MPHRCADCNHTMLISPDGATQGVACERCGGRRLEPDQPNPLHSDGDLRNMVDPGIGLDQGGNPNQEGIWATTDGGWQPRNRRDESFASVRTAMDFDPGMFDFESEPNLPSHHFIVDQHGGVFSGAYPQTHEQIADQHRLAEASRGVSKGALYPDGTTEFYTHSSGHSPSAMEQMLYGHFGVPAHVDPSLQGQNEMERYGLQPGQAQGELQTLMGPPRLRERGMPLDRNEGLVRGGGYERTSNQDPYLPWTHEAEVKEAIGDPRELEHEADMRESFGDNGYQAPEVPPYTQEGVIPGPMGIHAGTTKWLNFLHAHVNGVPVRDNTEQIIAEHGNPMAPTFGQPVTVSAFHPEHLAAAIDVINHSSSGGAPSPKMIDVGRRVQRGELEPPPGIGAANFKQRQARMIYKAFGIGDLAGLGLGAAGVALAPETGGASLGLLGGSGLLRAAAPTLMKGALMGVGSHLVQGLMGGGGNGDAAGQGASMPPPPRGVGSLAKVADMETPHTTPYLHDDPDGDPHQFQDGAESPGNLEHPGTSGEAGGAAVGEDNDIGPQFGPNSPSMERANMLFPALLHYYHSDQSGAQDPMIRELHDMMDKEVPGYLDHDENQGLEAVQHLVHHLRQPPGVHAKTAMQPGWNATPGTAPFTQPGVPTSPQAMQPGMMPQQAHCAYCGGVTTADGSCPQCGAKNMPGGAQTMQGQPGAMPGQGGAMTPTPFVGSTHESGPRDLLHKVDTGQYNLRGQPFSGGMEFDRWYSYWRRKGYPHQQSRERAMAEVNGMDANTPRSDVTNKIYNDITPPDRDTPTLPPGYYQDMRDPGARVAADTQGPVSPEQIAAVQQLLLDTGRAQEVPNVPIHPEQYAKELAQVAQQDQTVPPTIDPSQQPPPPPPMDPSQMGQMPMPGMSAPGGAPPGMTAKVASPHAGAPRCPKCKSATTGFINGLDGNAMGDCHSCGNTWEIPEAEVIKTSAEPTPPGANPLGVPAADQQQAYDPQQDQDSSHSWLDADSEPLVEGQDYEMFTPGMSIPDRVRIDKIKPDELLYSTIGEFDPDPTNPTTQPLTYQSKMSLEDFQLRGYQFQKAGDGSDAGEQNLDQYRDQSQAPVNTEPQPEPSAIQSKTANDVTPVPCPHCHGNMLYSPSAQYAKCQQCGAILQGPETQQLQHTMAATKESFGGPMSDQDPKGQFQVGQEVEYVPAGGGTGHGQRTERGTIVGFQTSGYTPGDPFVQNRFGQVKVVGRQDIIPDPLQVAASVQEDYCPKCASTEMSTHMSSATREFHECYKCGHGWESRVEEYEAEGGQRRAWVLDSGAEDDDFWNGFERAREMDKAGMGSRSLAAAAARDTRAGEIRERLDANKAEREARLAGKKFSPREQRAFVDERGVARNADKLDLAGTHYESHRYVGEKANGENVREEDLFLGI